MSVIYLASHSPRRHQLLREFGIQHKIVDHLFDEESLDPNTFLNKETYVKKLALNKAESVINLQNNWILSADTIVVFNNRVFNKPTDLNQAISYLETLSGNKHQVMTAFCLLNKKLNKKIVRCAKATITFNKLSKDQIKDYVFKSKPLDKAGGYAIQELPSGFVKKCTGSKFTVIGLPIFMLKRVIKRIHNNTLSL